MATSPIEHEMGLSTEKKNFHSATERLTELLRLGKAERYISDDKTVRTIPELSAQVRTVYNPIFADMVQYYTAEGNCTPERVLQMTMAYCAYAGMGGAALWMKNKISKDQLLIEYLTAPGGVDILDEVAFEAVGIEYESELRKDIALHIHRLAKAEYEFIEPINTSEQMFESFKAFFFYGIAFLMDIKFGG